VAFVGLGSVAQTVHWPVLRELPQLFTVTRVCDLSPRLRDWATAAVPGVAVHADLRDLLAAGGVDVVGVFSSDEYHADHAVLALEAGCDVLIEKPICLTLSDLDRIETAARRSGRTCMTGYMRRCAGGFEAMRATIAAMPGIDHVSVRDYIGPNAYFIGQVNAEVPGDDLPRHALADRAARKASMLAEATGSTDPIRQEAYRFLCGLGSHDLSAMRDLVGAPQGVIGAAIRGGGRRVAAILDHGSFVSTYESGLDRVGRFDAYIEVFGGTARARIEYDTPYVRHLPIVVRQWHTDGHAHREECLRETFTDPYTRQWRLFADILDGKRPNPMPPGDSRADLSLFAEIVARAAV
jgi:predicted dehydrogenase